MKRNEVYHSSTVYCAGYCLNDTDRYLKKNNIQIDMILKSTDKDGNELEGAFYITLNDRQAKKLGRWVKRNNFIDRILGRIKRL